MKTPFLFFIALLVQLLMSCPSPELAKPEVNLSIYGVTYNGNGASSGVVPDAQVKVQDVNLTLAANTGSLALEGYSFGGWNTRANGTGTSYSAGGSYTLNEDLTLYAVWTAIVYPVVLPDTGQVTSYTTVFGEDSDYSRHSPSYTDNGDGTITDNVTGLMWARDDGGEMTFTAALAYPGTLTLGGYSDWRLPTAQELFSINQFDAVNPALDTSVFTQTYPTTAYYRELYWWSSDQRVDTALRAWITNAGGGIGAHEKTETYSAGTGGTRYFHARAVRSISTRSLPAQRFIDNGDETVTDQYTGLIWMKNPSTSTYTWEGALAYAEQLTFAGKSDWRVPNIRELFSINDVGLSNPSLSSAYFPGVAALSSLANLDPNGPGTLWSSTAMSNNANRAWDLHDVYYGIVSYSEKTNSQYVLCVRN